MSAARSRHTPVFELAYGIDVKARLAGVPVYTVAKKDNSEFVLVSGEVRNLALHPSTRLLSNVSRAQSELGHPLQGENGSSPRQLGLFFFNESDAAAMVAKVIADCFAIGNLCTVFLCTSTRTVAVQCHRVMHMQPQKRARKLFSYQWEGCTPYFNTNMTQCLACLTHYRHLRRLSDGMNATDQGAEPRVGRAVPCDAVDAGQSVRFCDVTEGGHPCRRRHLSIHARRPTSQTRT